MVGMMFHVGNKNNRSLRFLKTKPVGEHTTGFKPQDTLEFYDGPCHSKSRGKDDILWACIYMLFDLGVGQMVGFRHQSPVLTGLSVGVPQKRPQLPGDDLFDRPVQPSTGNPVGIDHPLNAVRCRVSLVNPDGLQPERFKIVFTAHNRT